MTKNIDKIKISLGNEVFNHISSLNKSQLEKQLSELKSELSLADKKSQRYDKLKDEEWYILYRLEKTNDFKYETGGGIKWDMNWNSFTINEIRQWMKQHNIKDISVELGSKGYHKYDYKKDDNKKLYFYKSLHLRSGQENMYFDIIVTDDNNKEWIVSFFTKENRRSLKKIANSIVDIYAKGGSVGSSFEYTIGGL